jgi:amino acid adenylation domain-containing protein
VAERRSPLGREAARGEGPARALPALGVDELFQQRVMDSPSAMAVIHQATRWTYERLDIEASKIADALAASGLEPDDVVAYIGNRSPEWLASVIGIFRAGGVYLPIEPALPEERIRQHLERSECRFVLEDCEPGQGDGPLSVRVSLLGRTEAKEPEPSTHARAAYIYFTSGSTGDPKGAICLHPGMLNHLLAKIEVFELDSSAVVAQTAPLGFDISLWQALAPLLVGGATVIVDPETMLDAPALLGMLDLEKVTVLQVVPSYLDALLGTLDLGHSLPSSLKALGVTGEAVSSHLLRRWFDHCPAVPVVNAYGATEASDDTTHEVIRQAPEGSLISVGRPIQNVFVDVLDDEGVPVEGDEVGEISFSGICVGGGYVNDEERSRQAFTDDPVRPGLRRYLTGDFGHWLPDGRLNFVGRKDEQVKISGMRLELGEIEAQLLRVPAVLKASVIAVADGPSKRLAGFYCSTVAIPDLSVQLAEHLPAHAIPRTLRWVPELPLTANGKIDKRALADLETLMMSGNTAFPPITATERRIATAWAEVLDIPLSEIGRHDDFFALGGGSLAAVRFVVAVSGIVSLLQLAEQPVLADLARSVDEKAPRARRGLHALSHPANAEVTLVCLPYEGGNALNYAGMAQAIERSPARTAVCAFEYPGHDLARPDEEFIELEDLAAIICLELMAITTPVVLWGHGAGGALAIEVAKLLGESGTPPLGLILALAIDERDASSPEADADVAAWLRESGALTDFDDGPGARLVVAARAYAHDLAQAERYFGSQQAPIDFATSIVAIPSARGERTATDAYLRVLPNSHILRPAVAGRYFVKDQPTLAAALVDDLLRKAMDGPTR